MEKQYDNTNRGGLWVNDRKEAETHADFTGSVNIDGKEYWVNAWKKREGQSERAPSFSLSVKAKDAAPAAAASEAPQASTLADSDVPF